MITELKALQSLQEQLALLKKLAVKKEVRDSKSTKPKKKAVKIKPKVRNVIPERVLETVEHIKKQERKPIVYKNAMFRAEGRDKPFRYSWLVGYSSFLNEFKAFGFNNNKEGKLYRVHRHGEKGTLKSYKIGVEVETRAGEQ